MPNQETILKVFVSSPSDVKDERRAVVEIIEEINKAWATFLGIRLEAVLWETDCRPGIGSDPQQVINEQLPMGYDIFIGVLWKRFGTPTPRFGSGTEEEFHKAYERYKKHSKVVSVLFYFKNGAVSPTEIDPVQLAKLNKFRQSLGSKGVFYWNFGSGEEFRQFIRIHLARELQKWREKLLSTKLSVSGKAKQTSHRRTPRVDLASLARRSQKREVPVLRLMEQYCNALKYSCSDLDEATALLGKSRVGSLAVFVRANRSFCNRIEQVAGEFVQAIEKAVEAWIDEFMARLLLGKHASGISKKFLKRFGDYSRVLTKMATRQSQSQTPPVEILKVPEFRVAERRLQSAKARFADELGRTVTILQEARHIVKALGTKRTKGKIEGRTRNRS